MEEHQLAHAFKELARSIDRATDLREKEIATKQDLADVFHKLFGQTENWINWAKSPEGLATKQDLEKVKDTIMEAIQAFATRVTTKFNDIGKSVDGLVEDVTDLKQQITDLQNSTGTLSPEDQAALDAIEVQVGTVADRTAALDAATSKPPVPTP